MARAVLLFTIGFERMMRKIFSLIFVFLLLTPAAVWLIDLDFGLQVDRIGLKPPRFDGRALFDNEYYRSFDQYFNDNFSLIKILLNKKDPVPLLAGALMILLVLPYCAALIVGGASSPFIYYRF